MNLSNIPEQGIVYALYTDKVVYRKYNREELLKDTPLTEKLLELHLFDDTCEHRYIKKRKGTVDEVICDAEIAYEDIYVERVLTLGNKKEKPDRDSGFVEVVNYISYDENDLMRIENYRLKEVK